MIRLYAKRSAHPNILLGTHEMPIPLASQSGSFCREFPSVQSIEQLNISRADILCILENSVGLAPRSTHPVKLYITINIIPPTLYNSPPGVPPVDDDSPAEGAIIRGRIQLPTPEHPLPSSHDQSVETGNKPQSREEVSLTSTTNPRLALDRADEAMKRIVPFNRLDGWEGAVRRIKWVADTLGPIGEVRMTPF